MEYKLIFARYNKEETHTSNATSPAAVVAPETEVTADFTAHSAVSCRLSAELN